MKYLLFAYNNYYPQGGMQDCLGVFDSRNAMLKKILSSPDHYDDFHVYDIVANKLLCFTEEGWYECGSMPVRTSLDGEFV